MLSSVSIVTAATYRRIKIKKKNLAYVDTEPTHLLLFLQQFYFPNQQ